MNYREIQGEMRSMSKEDLDEMLAEQRRLILGGDMDTLANMQEVAIHQLVLRLATLLPDDPFVALCVRVLHADKEAMVQLSDLSTASIFQDALTAGSGEQ